jgi:hypothetical protein
MKKNWIVMLLMLALLSVLAAGCQVAGQGGGESTEAPEAAPNDPAYPGAGGAYPADPGAEAEEGAALYPWYESGTEVLWNNAIAMIMNGEVSQVAQAHDLTVTLTLKDGRTLTTIEPAIDEVIRTVEACGAPCSDILIATE